MRTFFGTAIGSAIAVVVTATIPFAAHADTVEARCDIYPIGEDRASAVTVCTFSQRQGAVGIQLENGRRYDLTPVGDQPGNFVDQNGNAAYRQAGLSDRGLIFQTVDERIFVYWDTAGIGHSSSSSGRNNPTTYTTFVDSNHIVIQVSDDGFYFHDTLAKLSGPDYAGSHDNVRVVLTPSSGRVFIFNERTGETLYDYTINPVYFGEDPNTMCNPDLEPC
jgi:hypothetical protein